MDAKLSPPSARRRDPRGIRPSTLVVFGLLLLAGTLIQACSDNNGNTGPVFECREQKGGAKVLAQCTGSPARVVGTVGANGLFNATVRVDPGAVDRGRRAGVQAQLTSPGGAPLQNRPVSLSSPGGKFDNPSGTTDPNGTFSTTMLVPCEVADGPQNITVIAEGKSAQVTGAFTVVTSLANDPCAGVIPTTPGPDGAPTLPSVSITSSGTASDANPPVSATFTVTRTGSTGSALAVVLVPSGSATFGLDYGLVGGNIVGTTVTIPAGASSVTFTLTPVPLDGPEGDDPSGPNPDAELAILTISPTATYTVGAPPAAQVEIIDGS
jgi:hypothetical protein